MPNKAMSIEQRYVYLAIQYNRYIVANRKEKGELLDEMEKVTGLNRKVLIRHMRKRPHRKARREQRGPKYGAKVQDAIHLIAKALDYPCPERLKPMLPWMMDKLVKHGHLHPSPGLRELLVEISVSTVGRILNRRKQDEPRLRRRSSGSADNAIQARVPIRRIPWDIPEAGHLEVDLVHHSGPDASGEFLYTLQMVDVCTGWVEPAAMLGRSFRVTRDAILRCLDRLPFPVREIHTDNGSEFMNHHLYRFWQTQYPDVDLSRIRPYKKQDNRFVEHRNGALIRALIGHDRHDTAQQAIALNAVYDRLWLYFNFFQPVMRQTSKTYEEGRVVRKHEDVRTPWQRVRSLGIVEPETKRELQALLEVTDPLALRAEIEELLNQFFRLPGAQAGQTEDIFETLAFPEPI